ncbi:hypothetical protein N9191_01825 [bacterium]|nr:hypothetical protein [bacterium]
MTTVTVWAFTAHLTMAAVYPLGPPDMDPEYGLVEGTSTLFRYLPGWAWKWLTIGLGLWCFVGLPIKNKDEFYEGFKGYVGLFILFLVIGVNVAALLGLALAFLAQIMRWLF